MASSSSLTLSNFLTSPLPPKSPSPSSPASFVSLPKTASEITTAATIALRPKAPPGIAEVVSPSVSHSNALWFKSAYNVQVIAEENEPEEKLVNRFRREVLRAGVLQECRRRRFFENSHDRKKRKAREAAKRNRRRNLLFATTVKGSTKAKQDSPDKKKDEADDNWDDFDVDLPY